MMCKCYKKNGERCKYQALNSSDYCGIHKQCYRKRKCSSRARSKTRYMRSELVKMAHIKGIKSTRGMTIDDLCNILKINHHRYSGSPQKKIEKKKSPHKKKPGSKMHSEEKMLNDVAGKIIKFLDSKNIEYDSLSYIHHDNGKNDEMDLIILYDDDVNISVDVFGNYPHIKGYSLSVSEGYNMDPYWTPYLTGDLTRLFKTQDKVISYLKKMFRL